MIGHPKRVLDTLQGQFFKEVLSLKASICLIDPRNLFNERYTNHENFIDQIALADILVANKSDLCDSDTLKHFNDYAEALQPAKQKIIKTQFGYLDARLLDYIPMAKRNAQFPDYHESNNKRKVVGERDGYLSEGGYFHKIIFLTLKKSLSFLNNLITLELKPYSKLTRAGRCLIFKIIKRKSLLSIQQKIAD